MPPFDVAALSDAVSDSEPAGANLEFDSDFGALERAAQGKPEQQYGSTVIAAEEPDWKEVATLAGGLLERTRDLRILAHFAVAQLHLAGLAAFASVLAQTAKLLDERWEQVHPQLDPEDDNDPTLRANALLRIAHPGQVLKFIRDLPLANSPRLGRMSWRDIAIATGEIEGDPHSEKPSETMIRSTFAETPPALLAALRSAAGEAAAAVAAVGKVFDERAGPGTGPDFDDLGKLLARVLRFLERFAPPPQATASPDDTAEAEVAPAPGESDGAAVPVAAAAAPRARAMTAAALTEVTTRADALRLLDLVCQYYRVYEPSSPLPLLIERARRLGDKNFLEILRDLAPDGLSQAQTIVGPRDE